MPNSVQVLIVDDDSNHVEMVTDLLGITSTFSVDWAVDIHSIWDHLAAHHYDIILLDYRLPDGTGLEALAEIGRRGYKVPVVMLTGQGDERIAVQAIQLGAMDYLIKNSDHLLTLPTFIEKVIRAYQTQLSARRVEARYRTLVEQIPAVTYIARPDELTGPVYISPQAREIFGYAPEEWISIPVLWARLVHPDDHARVAIDYRCFLENKAPFQVEYRVITRDGDVKWVRDACVFVVDDTGHADAIQGIIIDITEQKRMEAQILAAQSRLTQSARLATLGELASGVAHQINNPLTTIIADAQLLLQALPDNHESRESAEAISQAGWRAQAVVERLLDFSRPSTTLLQPISINQTIHHALALVGARIVSSGISLNLELVENLHEVRGNARQLEDLWVNLLLLAQGAMTDNQPHKISIRSKMASASTLCVEIWDNGIPISPDHLDTLFEPDFYGSATGRGTGIELSICREIVRQHAGEISAECTPESGTIFRIVFPLES